MNNRTKKWLVVAGCLVICTALVVLIGKGFTKAPVQDDPVSAADEAGRAVTVSPDTNLNDKDESRVVVIRSDTQTPVSNGAVSTGTEQTIQPDVTKPEEPEKPAAAADPDKPHENPTDPALTDPSTKPSDPPESNPTPPSQSQNSGGKLPGFDNVPNAGENQVIQDDDMRENGNKIGIMD